MSDPYGPYPVRGSALLRSPVAALRFPEAALHYERLGDEDAGYGYDAVEKVAWVDRFWSAPDTWDAVADWYGRQLQRLGWEPFRGDSRVASSAWPWEASAEQYRFQGQNEEILLVHYAHPSEIDLLRHELSFAAHADDLWFRLVLKAWSPGHER
jgi:hypothetical protein